MLLLIKKPYSIKEHNIGTQNCDMCGKGKYSDELGAAKCKTCENGALCDNGVKIVCDFGYYHRV